MFDDSIELFLCLDEENVTKRKILNFVEDEISKPINLMCCYSITALSLIESSSIFINHFPSVISLSILHSWLHSGFLAEAVGRKWSSCVACCCVLVSPGFLCQMPSLTPLMCRTWLFPLLMVFLSRLLESHNIDVVLKFLQLLWF